MKILIVSKHVAGALPGDFYYPGEWIDAVQFGLGLRSADAEVALLTTKVLPAHQARFEAEFGTVLKENDMAHHFAPTLLQQGQYGGSFRLRLFLGERRTIRAERPDIIVYLGLGPSLLVGLKHRPPIVPFIYWAAPRYEGYEKDRSMKQTWNNPLPLFGKWEHRLFSFLARKWGADSSENLLHMCDAIAMLHPQGYEALKQKPEFADKVFLAEKGVDLARADATAPRQEQVDVLFLGGIFHRKGIFDVVEAFARVNKVMPQASLGIAGSGPPELENEMRRMIAELGVNACHFGSVSFHDRWAYLKSARVFAFPSRRDQYNSSLLEAMACGLPAITTTAVDSPIRDGVNGFAIPPGDVPALADRMLRLLRDDAECTRMGRLARESVHDWRDVARQALDEIFVPLTGKDR